MESGDDKPQNTVAAASSSQMAKQKQGGKPSAFKKLLHKRPTSSHRHTMKREENEDLKKPTICKVSTQKEGCSSQDEIEKLLSLSFPSFLMKMLPSHVSGGYWLGLPRNFCVKHLPMDNDTLTLVDESGRKHEVKYLSGRTALSGGWKAFAKYHSLEEKDELFFELIKPCTFKVEIFRKYGSAGVVLNSDSQCKQLANVDVSKKKMAMHASENTSDHSPSVSEESSSEVSKGISFSDKFVEFKDVKTLEDFRIVVDDLVIDSEIPEHIRAKYYNLCTNQKGYLHSHFYKGLNCKMAAGAIIEAVNVSDAIRAVKITTPFEELAKWDKSLRICEDMGMELGFLRSRIGKMIALHSDETGMFQTKMKERAKVEEEIKKDEAKLLNVEGAISCYDKDFKTFQVPKCTFW